MAYLIVLMILASPVLSLAEVLDFEQWFLYIYCIVMGLIGLSILIVWENHKERVEKIEAEVKRLKRGE